MNNPFKFINLIVCCFIAGIPKGRAAHRGAVSKRDNINDTYEYTGVGQDWNQIRSLGGVIDNNINAAGGVVPQLKIINDVAIAYDQLGEKRVS